VAQSLEGQVLAALGRLQNPRLENDLVSAGMVRDLAVDSTGRVAFTFLLGRDDPATLVREARKVIRELDGVSDIKITVVDPAGAPKATHAPPGGPQSASTGVPAQLPMAQPNLGRVIAISSGKGGVGKSTVAVNLAVALARQGMRVGLMDADIYGPNIPRMMGVNAPPSVIDERIVPLEAFGVKVISLGFLIDRDQPAIWRGPIVMKIITQFLRDVAWGTLDYLIVDMPPGTGDAQLSLVQATQLAGALIVTTPQEVSVGDALRGVKMFQRVGVPVLGIVENMSWFECPHCGKPTPIFGSGGGERLAREVELPLLGQIPLFPRVLEGGDSGAPIVVADPSSAAARALSEIAGRVAAQLPAR